MEVITMPFLKAVTRLEEALNQPQNEFIRDSVIQRFEFCIELAWKTSRKVMGTTTTAPKQIIREMAQNNLIESPEIWILAIDERNRSSHTYNEITAEEIYQFAKGFLPHLKGLSLKIKTFK